MLEVLSDFLHYLPLVFLFIFWKPGQLWSKHVQEPQVQNKINVMAGSLLESLLLVPEGVLVLAEGLTSDTEGSSWCL